MTEKEQEFFLWMRGEKDYSDLTAEMYVTLLRALQARKVDLTNPDEVEAGILLFKPSSRHNYRQAWRAFREWVDGSPFPRRRNKLRPRNRVERLEDGSAYLWATNRAGEEIAAIRVDQEDLPLLLRHRWSISYRGKKRRPYIITQAPCPGGKPRKVLLLHRFLMKPEGKLQVDHVNGDPFDNRKSNLRVVTKSQQMQNVRVRSDSSTGFRNVTKSRSGGWLVTVTQKYIGSYDVLGDAIEAAAEARAALFTHHNETREGNFLSDYDDALRHVRKAKKSRKKMKGIPLSFEGKEYVSLAQLVEEKGVASYQSTYSRIFRRGWDLAKALKTPQRKAGRPRKTLD